MEPNASSSLGPTPPAPAPIPAPQPTPKPTPQPAAPMKATPIPVQTPAPAQAPAPAQPTAPTKPVTPPRPFLPVTPVAPVFKTDITPPPAPTPPPTPAPKPTVSTAEALENALVGVPTVTPFDAPTETIAPAKKKPKTLLYASLALLLLAGVLIALVATGVIDLSGRKPKPVEKEAAGPTAAAVEEVCVARGLNFPEMLPDDHLYESYKVILGDETDKIYHCVTPPETTIESGNDFSEEVVTVFFNGNYSEFDDEKNNNLVGSYRDAGKNGDNNVTVLENSTSMFKVVTVATPIYNYFVVYKNSMTFIKTSRIDSAESILNELEYPDRSHADPEATEKKIENAEIDEATKIALQNFNINIANYVANQGTLPAINGETELDISGAGNSALNTLYSNYLINIKDKKGNSYAFQASSTASEDLAYEKAITLHYKANCSGEGGTLQATDDQLSYALTHPSADGNKYYCVSGN